MNSVHDIKTGHPQKPPQLVARFDAEVRQWEKARHKYVGIQPLHANCKWLAFAGKLNKTVPTLAEAERVRAELKAKNGR